MEHKTIQQLKCEECKGIGQILESEDPLIQHHIDVT